MKTNKKPQLVKYLLYLTPEQFDALDNLKKRINKKKKKNNEYLTSIRYHVSSAIDAYLEKTKIKRSRKIKFQDQTRINEL